MRPEDDFDVVTLSLSGAVAELKKRNPGHELLQHYDLATGSEEERRQFAAQYVGEQPPADENARYCRALANYLAAVKDAAANKKATAA